MGVLGVLHNDGDILVDDGAIIFARDVTAFSKSSVIDTRLSLKTY